MSRISPLGSECSPPGDSAGLSCSRDPVTRRSRRSVDVVPELPVITADDVSARWRAGHFGRIEVYPIPESVAPGTPSAIVRPAQLPVAVPVRPVSGRRAADTPHFRFIVDGRPIAVEAPSGVIGRSPDSSSGLQTIAVTDDGRSLSRNHLGFEVDARGRLLVVDLRSANGSEIMAVDGTRVECVPGRRYVVENGDALLLGNFEVKIARS
ncbi:FHA domain-containing protein [Cryobacterium luteum]|uniref:FHA domain-containing protein n=1 Tax=Cryobacterium luteum TaxID=1424661 RepID=A0A5F0CZP2_9MICO|nr:FHA domain-containing protein [Cryobacterium luteum]